MRILVLAGGLSPERDVSLTSGSLVANALSQRGHEVLLLDPYLGTEIEGDPAALFVCDGSYVHGVDTQIPDLEALRAAAGNGDALIGRGVDVLCRAADVVYLAMHGDMGEDGRLQSYLDCLGVRYTGTGALGAMLSMDKDISKLLLRAAGVPTPDWIVIDPRDAGAADRIVREIGLPCVIKPCSCGSSVGVSIVESADALASAIAAGGKYENRLLAERKINGRELTVGYMEGFTLPPMEIIPKEGFYDYKNKYQSGLTEELCPAPLTEQQTAMLQALTARGFAALHLDGYARLDYILDADGVAWCLEANALPGMTPTSLLPQMAAYTGLDYGTLCETIIKLAFQK
ncbi:MAG: D-alanine--D-alanine ligase [Clostridia bacterium]|nr:D-alanine--D-alanine ligase [Clostridia bacterium]